MNLFPNTSQNAQRAIYVSPKVHDNKQSPARSAPSSSDHNQDATSPLPTEIDATGSTSQVSVESPKYADEPLSPCKLTPDGEESKVNSAALPQESGACDCRGKRIDDNEEPDTLSHELSGYQNSLLTSKEHASIRQDPLSGQSDEMQVDAGATTSVESNGRHKDSITSLGEGHGLDLGKPL